MVTGGVKRIGLLAGHEWSWPPAFIEEINRRDEGVIAELIKLGGSKENEHCPYDVIVDRISHKIPYYRTYLKHAVLQGTYVINNPFMSSAGDRFFEISLANRLGLPSPRTILLPNKEYLPGIAAPSLRNLEYPLDWEVITSHVGLPAILKDAHGSGSKTSQKIENIDELLFHYDKSGRLQLILQEYIEWDRYIRCICIGQRDFLPLEYDPKERRYHIEAGPLSPGLATAVEGAAQKLCSALGYDMNAVEFAIRNDDLYVIDFLNPAPDIDIYSLTPTYFNWVVEKMADTCIRRANQEEEQRAGFHWYREIALQ